MRWNELIVRRWFDDINTGHGAIATNIGELIAEDYVRHDAVAPLKGRDALREAMNGMFRAFPNLHARLEGVVCEGDFVAYRIILSGTHSGEVFQGILPTGRWFEAPLLGMARIAHGRIAEEWQVLDHFTLHRQLRGTESEAEANKQVVHDLVQALNDGDLARIDALASADFVYHGPGLELFGPGALKSFLREVRTAFPDLRAHVERMVAEGDLVTTHWTLSGVQQTDFMGIPARGGHLHLAVIAISRLRDGLVVEDWEVYDAAQMRQQLEAGALALAT